jgi:hypothetical protein
MGDRRGQPGRRDRGRNHKRDKENGRGAAGDTVVSVPDTGGSGGNLSATGSPATSAQGRQRTSIRQANYSSHSRFRHIRSS